MTDRDEIHPPHHTAIRDHRTEGCSGSTRDRLYNGISCAEDAKVFIQGMPAPILRESLEEHHHSPFPPEPSGTSNVTPDDIRVDTSSDDVTLNVRSFAVSSDIFDE